jgi:hypothetical protein
MIRGITGFGAGNGPMIAIHEGFVGIAQWDGFMSGADRLWVQHQAPTLKLIAVYSTNTLISPLGWPKIMILGAPKPAKPAAGEAERTTPKSPSVSLLVENGH